MKKKLHILLTATLFLFFTCVIQVQAAEGIALNYTKTTINVGDSIHFELTGSDKTPVWTSYNENIVKINQNGEATALRTGKTTIKARVGFQYKTCTVTVVNSSIKLNKSAATIYSGGTSTNTVLLKATVKGASKTVIWETSDPSVATVDEKGRVTSVSAGAAVITATANSRTASCSLTVKESSISLNMDTLQVSTRGAGSSIKVTPVITGSKKTVKWSSSDKTVAAVSGGKITGKKTGTATITATANGVSASCNVIVTEGISINEEKVLLYAGGTKIETKQLKTNAGKKDTVIWSSSNPEAVSVSEKGLITAVGAGTSVISAECNGKTDTCEVTVNASSTDILEDNISLKTKGTAKTYTLEKTVTGRSSSIKWTTSDKSIAAVSKGKVTAKKAGTTTITATANGVSDSVTVTVANYDPTIKLNHSQYTLYTKKGNILSLKAAVDGAGKAVLWETSDTSVATVTNKGKVTAVGAGNVTITASANGVSTTCNIEVKETSVTLEKANIALKKGETDSLPVDITGLSQSVKWSTANSKIATVKNGVVTAKNYGETDIKVTANGITSLCHVTVAEFVCEHTFDEGVITKESTCTREGICTFTCTLCGYSYTENLPLKDHEWEEYSRKEASCLTKGSVSYRCENCVARKTEELEPLGHNWSEWQLVMPPTITADGTEKQVCYRCQLEQERSIPKVEHTHEYISVITEPTCTEQGYTTYTCECGSSYVDDYVEAKGHNGEYTTIKEPTCTEYGFEAEICTICKAQLEGYNNLAPKGHTISDWITDAEADCTTDGSRHKECSVCSAIIETETIKAGHVKGEWIVTKEPSTGAATDVSDFGTRERYCSTCNEKINTENIINVDLGNGNTEQICGTFREDMAYETFEMVNELRASVGVEALEWSNTLEIIGKIRGAELTISYSHKRPNGKPIPLNHYGENIAIERDNAQEVFDAWKNSSGHYRNMTNAEFKGYYCACIEDAYGLAWVQIFSSTSSSYPDSVISPITPELVEQTETEHTAIESTKESGTESENNTEEPYTGENASDESSQKALPETAESPTESAEQNDIPEDSSEENIPEAIP